MLKLNHSFYDNLLCMANGWYPHFQYVALCFEMSFIQCVFTYTRWVNQNILVYLPWPSFICRAWLTLVQIIIMACCLMRPSYYLGLIITHSFFRGPIVLCYSTLNVMITVCVFLHSLVHVIQSGREWSSWEWLNHWNCPIVSTCQPSSQPLAVNNSGVWSFLML